MPGANRHRVLVISQSTELRNEIVTLLSGYGYFVEFCHSRLQGISKFRAHKQSIVILDVPVMRTFPRRLFQFIHMVRRNTIVLIAAHRKEEAEAVQRVDFGAYDILHLPLKTDFLKLTLARALEHQRLMLENLFVKNVLFFGLVMSPIWATLTYLIIR